MYIRFRQRIAQPIHLGLNLSVVGSFEIDVLSGASLDLLWCGLIPPASNSHLYMRDALFPHPLLLVSLLEGRRSRLQTYRSSRGCISV